MCRSGQGNRQAWRRRGAATIQSQRRTAQAGTGMPEASGRQRNGGPEGGSRVARGCLRKVTVITNVLPVVLASCLMHAARATCVPTRFSRACHTRRRHGSLLQVAGMSNRSIARRASNCIGAANSLAAPPLGDRYRVAPCQPAGPSNGGRSIQSTSCRVGRTVRPQTTGSDRWSHAGKTAEEFASFLNCHG
jgi:hypothetical protein